MTENKHSQQTEPKKPNYLLRRAGALAAAVVLAGGVAKGVSEINGESASAGPKQEQLDPRYTVQEGDTLEEIAEKDLKNRAKDQAFAEDPTPAEVDVREREIAGASNLASPEEFTTPDDLKVGQELVVPDSTEVPIHVTPEVAPEDLHNDPPPDGAKPPRPLENLNPDAN